MSEPEPEHVDVLILGAGFSGICVAAGLARMRGVSFRILERAGDVGGTWRENTYPGCACDIPSPLYSFSFAQSSSWSRLFAPQGEILDYLRRVAADRGLLDRIRFGTAAVSAAWDEAAGLWRTTAADGSRYTSRFLVSAIGALHRPKLPVLPGLDTFAGPAFHSAQWDHAVDLTGQRVAVVGTGASAIQLVPAIVDRVAAMTVFQRTPPWILPKLDRPFDARAQRRMRWLPPYRWYLRERLFWIHEGRAKGFVSDPSQMADTERFARGLLDRQVQDPELRARLTPDYAIGCKRLLISSDYYPALVRDHVTLDTSGVREVRPDGVLAADGTHHPADVILYGTGFDVQNGLTQVAVTGRGGRELRREWAAGGMEAYLGTTVSGYPNMFVMAGPNSGLGHNSQVFMIEAQARYVRSCLRVARRRRGGRAAIEVRADVQRSYNAALQRRMDHTVWQTGGCRSWYYDPVSGRNTLLWPGGTIEFYRRTRRARRADYAPA
jgi:cation diffusion facilitator CzcD-associated flavoprotein CzcO